MKVETLKKLNLYFSGVNVLKKFWGVVDQQKYTYRQSVGILKVKQ